MFDQHEDDLRAILKACIAASKQKRLSLDQLHLDYSTATHGGNLKLEVGNLGHKTVLSFLESDPDAFEIINKGVGMKAIIACRENSTERKIFGESRVDRRRDGEMKSTNNNDDDEFWNESDEIIVPKLMSPGSNCAKYTNMIASHSLPVDSKLLDIVITECHSPQRFWFATKDETDKIGTIINSMTKHYNQGLGQHAAQIQVDDLVAVLHEKLWYRARVTEVRGANVLVFCIDIGSVELVDTKTRVCKLHKAFCDEPMYLKRGSLLGYDHFSWTENTKNVFYDIVSVNSMIAEVIMYDPRHRVHSLKVSKADTAGGKEQNLIDVLMCKGLCRQKSDESIKLESFDDLENGKFLAENAPMSVEKKTQSPVFEQSTQKTALKSTNDCRKNMNLTKPKSNGISTLNPTSRAEAQKFKSSSSNESKKQAPLTCSKVVPVLKSSGVLKQILPQSLGMFKVEQIKEVVIHVIDKSTLDFNFFLKDELREFKEFSDKFNNCYKNEPMRCADFTIGNDVAVFHDKNYCRGRINKISPVGAVEIELLDFGFFILRSHDDVFKLHDEWMSKRRYIFPGCLSKKHRGKVDYDTFISITKSKIVKAMVTGKVDKKIELDIKELLDVVAVEQ